MSNQTNSNTIIVTPTSLYGYIPTLWVSVTFLSLFAVTTVIHIFQALSVKPRKYWILPTFALCGIGEVIGWSGRLMSSINSENRNAYLVQITTTILAPIFLAAGLYTILAVMIRGGGEVYGRFKPKTYIKIFITVDIISLFIQGGGGGIAASSNSTKTSSIGGDVVLVGIVFQLVSLLFFTALAVEVIYRFRSKKPLKRYAPISLARGSMAPGNIRQPFIPPKSDSSMPEGRINLVIIGLSISTFLLIVRSIYRSIELADGWQGTITHTQIYFILFDAIPISLAMLILNLSSPAVLLRSKSNSALEMNSFP